MYFAKTGQIVPVRDLLVRDNAGGRIHCNINTKFIKDRENGEDIWLRIYYKWNHDETLLVANLEFHVNSPKNINGAGWRKGLKNPQFGMTIPID